MKTITKKKLLSTMVAASLFAFGISYGANSTPAAPTNAGSTSATNQNTQPTLGKPISIAKGQFVQTYHSDDLTIQFQYSNGKLVGMQLINQGKHGLRVNVLDQNYVLGPNDSVTVNPPNVPTIHVYHAIYYVPETTFDVLFPIRFGTEETFVIPKNISDSGVSVSNPVSAKS